MNREARRVDKEIKQVLGRITNKNVFKLPKINSESSLTDEFGDDEEKKVQLLTGKRVTLAEELSK